MNCEQEIKWKVSFCTTCKGRLYQLKETLLENIAANAECAGVEYVLLDYSSPDGLGAWAKIALEPYIQAGVVVYYRLNGASHYISTHAKNVAHRLARGLVVCNLDADNFTGPNFARYIYEALTVSPRTYICARGVRGASGRLAFLKSDFESLGGYDEDIRNGWGFDDDDLKLRAKAIGLKEIAVDRNSSYLRVIQHDDRERLRY